MTLAGKRDNFNSHTGELLASWIQEDMKLLDGTTHRGKLLAAGASRLICVASDNAANLAKPGRLISERLPAVIGLRDPCYLLHNMMQRVAPLEDILAVLEINSACVSYLHT